MFFFFFSFIEEFLRKRRRETSFSRSVIIKLLRPLYIPDIFKPLSESTLITNIRFRNFQRRRKRTRISVVSSTKVRTRDDADFTFPPIVIAHRRWLPRKEDAIVRTSMRRIEAYHATSTLCREAHKSPATHRAGAQRINNKWHTHR